MQNRSSQPKRVPLTPLLTDKLRRKAFFEVAEARHAELLASRRAIPWSDMRHYLEQHVAEKPVRRPHAKHLPR